MPGPEASGANNQKIENGPNAGELKFIFTKVPGQKVICTNAHPIQLQRIAPGCKNPAPYVGLFYRFTKR
jgi:hypothetical protein